jgi:hypothetical protein
MLAQPWPRSANATALPVRLFHRVPVVDEAEYVRGIVTLNDLAHHRHGKVMGEGVGPDEVATTLAIISTPRTSFAEKRLAA